MVKNAMKVVNIFVFRPLEALPFLCLPALFVSRLSQAVFKNAKKKVERGIAFPTCVSVNNVVGHYSAGTGDETALAEGDLVKM